MHQLLKLQHHRHTGKLLHHRHTSYRGLAALLVIAGFFMLAVSAANHAAADTFGVAAMVESPIPTTPATIASPNSGTSISSSSVLIVGSCPIVTPQVVVRIRVDGITAGTGACDSDNDFSVPITLSAGNHQITAGTITITDQQGPTSSPIQLTSTAATTTPTAEIAATGPFIYLGADKTATWTGQVTSASGGPQHVHIDWGDGNQNNLTVQPGEQSFSHHYTTLDSRNIWLAVASPSGGATSEQFAVAAYTTAAVADTAIGTTTPPFDTSTMIGLYGLYVTALSVTAVFWLEAKHAARAHPWRHALS
jgi:hypothetical protein